MLTSGVPHTSNGFAVLRGSLAVSLLTVAFAGIVIAGPFEDTVTAYGRGEYATALQLLRPLANQGDARAQYNLGVMCENGQGGPQDYVAAHKWFDLAASSYHTAAAEARDKAVKNRDATTKKMTAAQIAEAQKLAREWKPK